MVYTNVLVEVVSLSVDGVRLGEIVGVHGGLEMEDTAVTTGEDIATSDVVDDMTALGVEVEKEGEVKEY